MAFLAMCSLRVSAEPTDYATQVVPLLETYCYGCHSMEERKGGLDMTRFKTLEEVREGFDLWKRIGNRIETREMPPGKMKKPEDAERTLLLEFVKAVEPLQTDCNQLANDDNSGFYRGYVMSRRLNRAEYNNSVRDLFGVDMQLKDLFPADGAGGEGFDNNGDALFLSDILMEKYLAAAERALEATLPEPESRWHVRLGRWVGRVFTLKWTKSDEEIERDRTFNRIILAKPEVGLKPREAAQRVVAEFARRAWRRRVPGDEVERLLAAYDRGSKRGDSWLSSVKLSLKAVMISPNFVFLVEPEPNTEGVYALGGFPLASRLSYFIWASMPDEELFALAESGRLLETETLRAQVRRMLRDPKSRGLAETFGTQWLEIENLVGGAKRPDENRFPEFTDELALDMLEEAVMLFDDVFQNDRNLMDLVGANYSFLNDRLAQHYGIEGVEGPWLRRVELADANRGGVLGLGSVLTATSHPLRTSPVLRGKFVMEQILGEHIPPPPPNVANNIPPDDVQPDGKTLRARLESHRENPECAGCHARIDPIGFGMENFDPIGRWRTEAQGQPLDTVGVLTTGEKFSTPAELKQIILSRKEPFARHLSKKMLGFALGRQLSRFDLCVVDECLKALNENDWRATMIVEQIALSYPFRHRYAKK